MRNISIIKLLYQQPLLILFRFFNNNYKRTEREFFGIRNRKETIMANNYRGKKTMDKGVTVIQTFID